MPFPFRTMPAAIGQRAAGGARLDSRDQARRLPDPGASARAQHSAATRNGQTLPTAFRVSLRRSRRCPVRSCVVDGEAIVCDDGGLAVFDLIRGHTAPMPARSSVRSTCSR